MADDKLDSLAVRFIPCAEWVGTVLEANMFHSLFAEYALLLFRKLSYPADNQVRWHRSPLCFSTPTHLTTPHYMYTLQNGCMYTPQNG